MTLTRWDGFESLFDLQKDIDQLLGRRLSPVLSKQKSGTSDWVPSVDIHEDKENYYFDVEAPGVDKENLDVKVENAVLTVRGERKRSDEMKEKNYYRVEREYGSFMRSFSLPETADANTVLAEYKNGVLHVKIAKKEIAKPRQIQVQIV